MSSSCQRFPKTFQGDGSIPVLAPSIARLDDDPARVVGEADSALGAVLVLAAPASGTEGVDAALREKLLVIGNPGRVGVRCTLRHETSV